MKRGILVHLKVNMNPDDFSVKKSKIKGQTTLSINRKSKSCPVRKYYKKSLLDNHYIWYAGVVTVKSMILRS